MPAAQCPLKAVIFDLDGVLVSTSRFHALAWAELVRSMGHQPPADLEERVKGISRLASLKIALGENARNYTDEQLTELATQKNDHYLRLIGDLKREDLFDGALELFQSLKDAGIAILLGSASKNAKPVLDALNITDWFSDIIDGFRYKHGKPHPDIFRTAAAAAGAQPEECIVVEDAAAGICSALDAGCVTVAIGSYESLKHAHLFIGSLGEISAGSLAELHARWCGREWVRVEKASPADLAGAMAMTAGETVGPRMQMTFDGQAIDPTAGRLAESHRSLNLRSGMNRAAVRWVGPDGLELNLVRQWFADATDPRRAFSQYYVEPLNRSGELAVELKMHVPAAEAELVTDQAAIDDAGVAVRLGGSADAVGALGMAWLDRPEAEVHTATGDGGPTLKTAAKVEQDNLLYFDTVSVCDAPAEGDDAFIALRTALPEALKLSFAEARIASTADWAAFWAENDPAEDADDAVEIRAEAYEDRLDELMPR